MAFYSVIQEALFILWLCILSDLGVPGFQSMDRKREHIENYVGGFLRQWRYNPSPMPNCLTLGLAREAGRFLKAVEVQSVTYAQLPDLGLAALTCKRGWEMSMTCVLGQQRKLVW